MENTNIAQTAMSPQLPSRSGSLKQRLVFFVRDFNDIDHMTPLIDHYCRQTTHSVSVFCLNWEYDLNTNINITYLKSRYSIEIRQLWSADCNSIFSKFVTKLISVLSHLQDINFPGVWRLNKFSKTIQSVLYTYLDVEQLLSPTPPSLFVFDYLNAGATRNANIVRLAQRHNIPTLCVPHGITMYSNQNITKKSRLTINSQGLYFDCYTGAGGSHQYLTDKGIPGPRIRVLGNMRYSPFWLNIHNNHIATDTFDWPTSNLCVVVFLMQSAYNVDEAQIVDTIRVVRSIPNVNIAVKPHPRGMSQKFLQKLVGDNVRIVTTVSSTALTRWANVAIAYGSSIAVQVLADEVTLLYPRYFDSNSTFFDECGACYGCDSPAELVDIIEKLKNNHDYQLYPPESVSYFFEKIVYADSNKDIIGKYANSVSELTLS